MPDQLSLEATSDDNSKHCALCDSIISARATVCPVCQKTQNPLRNQLLFFSSIIGLLSFGLAVVSTSYKEIHELYRAIIYGDQIIAIDLQTNGRGVFYNNGYRPLFIVRADFRIDELNYDQTIDIYRTVNESQFVTAELGQKRNKTFVSSISDTDLKQVKNGQIKYLFAGATLTNSPSYQHEKRKSSIPEFNCIGRLFYLPPGVETKQVIDLDCSGVIFLDLDQLTMQEYLEKD